MRDTTLSRVLLLIFSLMLMASKQSAAKAGQLDPSFGKGGIVTTDFGDQASSQNLASANAIAVQPDGKIVVCGAIPGSNDFPIAAVARYHTNGSLDKSFGTSGIVSVASIEDIPFTGIALQPDGKIVATAGGFSAFLVRFNHDGALDSSFGSGGIVSLGFINGPSGSGVVIEPDGKILVANNSLFRFLGDGEPDTSFGANGKAMTAGYPATGLALLSNGKILVVSSEVASGFISQYESNGALDTTFGINGQLATPGTAVGLSPSASGDILAAGSLTNNSIRGSNGQSSSSFAVSSYQSVGIADGNFGTNGGTATPVPNFSTVATSGLGLQASGDIVTVGTVSQTTNIITTAFALARYTANGQLDTSFGNDGTVVTSFGGGSQVPSVSGNAIAIQSDGKIVVVGSYAIFVPYHGVDTAFQITRYLNQ